MSLCSARTLQPHADASWILLAQIEARIQQTIEAISSQHGTVRHLQASATAQLQNLEEELAEQQALLPALPQMPEGLSLVRVRARAGPQLWFCCWPGSVWSLQMVPCLDRCEHWVCLVSERLAHAGRVQGRVGSPDCTAHQAGHLIGQCRGGLVSCPACHFARMAEPVCSTWHLQVPGLSIVCVWLPLWLQGAHDVQAAG